MRVIEAGIDEESFGDLFDWVNPIALGLVTEDVETGVIGGAQRTSELDVILVPIIISIFMYGALLAALGSACNDLAEAQSITFPAMVPMMLPMFIMMPVIQNPESTFSTVISLFLMQGTPPKLKHFVKWAVRG